MKNLRMVAVCIFAITVAAAAVSAQMGMRQTPMPQGVFNPVVGSGAQYDITSSAGTNTTMQYTVVGKETDNGKNAYWIEWTMSGGPMGSTVMKMLFTVDGGNTVPSRMIMQMAGRPPMEMPAQMNRAGSQQPQPADIRKTWDNLGKESVTTPAGTFTCDHLRAKDGSSDTWVSDKLSPWGLVKHQGKDSTMVLTKVITDAKDKIVGTPVPFNPMQMMQQAQPPQ